MLLCLLLLLSYQFYHLEFIIDDCHTKFFHLDLIILDKLRLCLGTFPLHYYVKIYQDGILEPLNDIVFLSLIKLRFYPLLIIRNSKF